MCGDCRVCRSLAESGGAAQQVSTIQSWTPASPTPPPMPVSPFSIKLNKEIISAHLDNLSKQCKQCSCRRFAKKQCRFQHVLYISFIFIFVDSFLIDTIPFFIVLASKTKYKSNEVLVQSLLNCRTLLGVINCNLIHKSFELDGAIGTKRGLM